MEKKAIHVPWKSLVNGTYCIPVKTGPIDFFYVLEKTANGLRVFGTDAYADWSPFTKFIVLNKTSYCDLQPGTEFVFVDVPLCSGGKFKVPYDVLMKHETYVSALDMRRHPPDRKEINDDTKVFDLGLTFKVANVTIATLNI